MLAEHCNVSQSTISDLSRGVIAEPKHSLGQALIGLSKSKKSGRVAETTLITDGRRRG